MCRWYSILGTHYTDMVSLGFKVLATALFFLVSGKVDKVQPLSWILTFELSITIAMS